MYVMFVYIPQYTLTYRSLNSKVSLLIYSTIWGIVVKFFNDSVISAHDFSYLCLNIDSHRSRTDLNISFCSTAHTLEFQMFNQLRNYKYSCLFSYRKIKQITKSNCHRSRRSVYQNTMSRKQIKHFAPSLWQFLVQYSTQIYTEQSNQQVSFISYLEQRKRHTLKKLSLGLIVIPAFIRSWF